MSDKVTHEEAEKIFKDRGIVSVADGIGNCDISYRWNDGYVTQDISLGGYCDMEPYKWTVAIDWKLGKSRSGRAEWHPRVLREIQVDCHGEEYDRESGTYLMDREYLDLILAARDKLLLKLPQFKEVTDGLHEKELECMYSCEVKPVDSLFSHKWRGHLEFRGKKYRTEVFGDFMEAKRALDQILEECMAGK